MKISGGAWKLVLAFFCVIGVWVNFLLGNLCCMYFWLACTFGLVVWYGWTYQDRKAEYDETRAKIAQAEEHLRQMKQENIERAKAEQEARERAAREQAERVKSEQERSLRIFESIIVDIPTHQPEANESATRGEKKTADSFPEIAMSQISKNTPADKICDFYVVDVETTGLQAYRNEIIQLTAMRFESFEPVECFSTYVMPRKGLNEEAQEINGICDDDLEGAPYIEQIIAEFDNFIGTKLPLVGHNIIFDLKFLHASGSEAIFAKRRIFDTCALAKRTYEFSNYKLDYLTAKRLNIVRKDAHDSKSDCLATGLLFKDICQSKIMEEKLKNASSSAHAATHSNPTYTHQAPKPETNSTNDMPAHNSNNADDIEDTIRAQRIIDGAPLKYKYEIPLESADEDAIYAAYLAGELEYTIGNINDEDAVILIGDNQVGIIHERIDMLQDWEDRGDPYRIYPSHSGNGDNRIWLYFYRDRRKKLDWKEQSVVTLVGYKGEDEQLGLIDAAPGDELDLVDDYDDKLNDIVRVNFDGYSIGRLPKSAAEKFGEYPRADAFIERIDTDNSGNNKPVIRIFW